MKPAWTLIANSTHARLLQQQQGEPMIALKSFEHAQGRSKVSELADDRMGHESADGSWGGTSFQPRVDAKRKQQGRFASLVLFASSPFLGELKAALGDAARRLLAGTHDLDLTAVGLAELEKRIAHELAH
jgi:protein required for attachment to host cells